MLRLVKTSGFRNSSERQMPGVRSALTGEGKCEDLEGVRPGAREGGRSVAGAQKMESLRRGAW